MATGPVPWLIPKVGISRGSNGVTPSFESPESIRGYFFYKWIFTQIVCHAFSRILMTELYLLVILVVISWIINLNNTFGRQKFDSPFDSRLQTFVKIRVTSWACFIIWSWNWNSNLLFCSKFGMLTGIVALNAYYNTHWTWESACHVITLESMIESGCLESKIR